jgi:hypothetical protein
VVALALLTPALLSFGSGVASAATAFFTADTPPLHTDSGATYTYTFTVTTPACFTPPQFSLSTASPSWLTIGSSSGTVSGVPPAGTTSFTYAVVAQTSYPTSTASCRGAQPTTLRLTTGTFTVTVGAPTATTGAIEGTVTVPAGSSLSAGAVCASAFPTDHDQPTTTPVEAVTASAQPDGTYTISPLPPGSYAVEFHGCRVGQPGRGSSLVDQWYEGQRSETAATPVTVTAGHTTTGIDAVVQTGARITGVVSVRSGATLTPEDVCVFVFDQHDHAVANGTVDAAGDYQTSGLVPGTYDVAFTRCGTTQFLAWYRAASTRSQATAVTVAGQQVTGIDITLPLSSTPSPTGTVRFVQGGLPVDRRACLSEAWTVHVAGHTATCASAGDTMATITVPDVAPGTHAYTITPPTGDLALPGSGVITVSADQTTIVPVAIAPGHLGPPSVTSTVGSALAPGLPLEVTGSLSLDPDTTILFDGHDLSIVPAGVPVQISLLDPAGTPIDMITTATGAAGAFRATIPSSPLLALGSGYQVVVRAGGLEATAPVTFEAIGQLSVTATPAQQVTGAPVTVAGTLVDGTTPVPNARVAIEVGTDGGTSSLQLMAVTGPSGAWTATFTPSGSTSTTEDDPVTVRTAGDTATTSATVVPATPAPQPLFSVSFRAATSSTSTSSASSTTSTSSTTPTSYTVTVVGNGADWARLVAACADIAAASGSCPMSVPIAEYLAGTVASGSSGTQVFQPSTATYPLDAVRVCPGSSATCAASAALDGPEAEPILSELLDWAGAYDSCVVPAVVFDHTTGACTALSGLAAFEPITSSSWVQAVGVAAASALQDVVSTEGLVNAATATIGASAATAAGTVLEAIIDAGLGRRQLESAFGSQCGSILAVLDQALATSWSCSSDHGPTVTSLVQRLAGLSSVQQQDLVDDIGTTLSGQQPPSAASTLVASILSHALGTLARPAGTGAYTFFESYFSGATVDDASSTATEAVQGSLADAVTSLPSLAVGLGTSLLNSLYIQPTAQILATDLAIEQTIGGITSPCSALGISSGGTSQLGLGQALVSDLCTLASATTTEQQGVWQLHGVGSGEAVLDLEGAVDGFMGDWAHTDIQLVGMEYLHCLIDESACTGEIERDQEISQAVSGAAFVVYQYDNGVQSLADTTALYPSTVPDPLGPPPSPPAALLTTVSSSSHLQRAGTLQATASANGGPSVTASTTGLGSVSVAVYDGAPVGTSALAGGGAYFDVEVSAVTTFTTLEVLFCGIPSSSVLTWWNPAEDAWQDLSPPATSSDGCLQVTLTDTTTPSIAELAGTIFGATSASGTPPPVEATPVTHPGPITVTRSSSAAQGYWAFGADGGVFAFGRARFHGSLPELLGPQAETLTAPIVAAAVPPGGGGYWMAGADGGVFAFGDAPFLGSLPGQGITPAAPIVAMLADPSGAGYWLVGADGGVFAFGDAPFLGSLPAEHLVPTSPVVAAAVEPDGLGYWLVTAAGQVHAFGTATDDGSLPALGVHPAAPIVSIVPTPSGAGYWLVGADGGVFAFGDAPFPGSLPSLGVHPAHPVAAATTVSSGGLVLVGGMLGGIFAIGPAPYLGSIPGLGLVPDRPIVAIAADGSTE